MPCTFEVFSNHRKGVEMTKFIESVKSAAIVKSLKNGAGKFLRDEEGAQIVEYALIIAMVSIALAVALSTLLNGTPSIFESFVNRVKACLSGAASGCTAAAAAG
jgi:pilus assembly protein Flp/PilA